MKKEKYDKINLEDQLKEQQVVGKMPDKDEFWQEFRSRAGDVVQDKPGLSQKIPFIGLKFAKIAAGFCLLAVAIWGYIVYNGSGNGKNGLTAGQGSIIENYEFFTPNEGVMIWQDQDEKDQSSATILWVIDSDENFKKDEKNET